MIQKGAVGNVVEMIIVIGERSKPTIQGADFSLAAVSLVRSFFFGRNAV